MRETTWKFRLVEHLLQMYQALEARQSILRADFELAIHDVLLMLEEAIFNPNHELLSKQ